MWERRWNEHSDVSSSDTTNEATEFSFGTTDEYGAAAFFTIFVKEYT